MMDRRDLLKWMEAVACASAILPLTNIATGQTSPPKWKTAIGLNGFQSSPSKYGWIMIDAREISDGYDACAKGLEAINRAQV
jgi:hypothetical protein